ncbi:hypothetical protein, partial [Bacteroides fragilis]|uniref:hypothetical protein n=1 Tax=Bacteroides fragilis TaxID=817 RepID=UPI0039B36611
FRTEKLSLITPMVLRNSGRVGSRRFFRWFIPFGRKTGGDDLFYTGGGGKGAPGCPISTLTPGVGKVGYK